MTYRDFTTKFNVGDIIIPVGNPFDEQLGEIITYDEKIVIETKNTPYGQWIKYDGHDDWIHAAWFKKK
jgi:hypothetical protein